MKYLITTLLLSITLIVHAQENRSIIGAGVERISYSSNDPDISLTDDSYEGVYLEYDWLSGQYFGFGLEGHFAITGPTYYDVRLKAGYVLNGKSRIQVPIFPYVGAFVLEEDGQAKHQGVAWGIQGGLRFYITDNMSLQGTYHYTAHGVNQIGTRKYNENIAIINMNGISVGVMYYLGG